MRKTKTPELSLDELETAEGRLLAVRAINDLIELLNGELPEYASNAAATAAGLKAGRWYRTASGEVRVVV